MISQPIADAATALTAVVGLYVAYLAYRGYRKNASPVMRALAVGIVLIAVVPFLVINVVTPAARLTDGQGLLAVLVSHTAGLVVIYATLRG
ncbi:DUF7521 family protein [Halostella litorea]|uniref:DUF7521 family protein n=1 Tax=Halostella litorea TaxID=2528831 RepID=UPI0010928ABD|nr:hypothetical protein [Halostella litorea]